MPFAIMRTTKHADYGKLAAAAAHHLRARPVANADPERAAANRHGGPSAPAELVAAIRDRAEPLVRRRDAVRCIEVLLTASPEWFAGDREGRADQLGQAASRWLGETFGRDNVLGVGLHMDETSPHVWALVTPVVDGRLCAAHWLDGPERMRRLQDGWAAATAPLELERGVRRSGAKHTTIRAYYAAANGDAAAAAHLAREQSRRARAAQRRQAEAERRAAQAEQRAAEASAEEQRILQANGVRLAMIRQLDVREQRELAQAALDEISPRSPPRPAPQPLAQPGASSTPTVPARRPRPV